MRNYSSIFNDQNKLKMSNQSTPVLVNASKKILSRQSMFRTIDQNIKQQIKKNCSFLNQEQIKTSSIYQKLLQRLQKVKIKENQQKYTHKNSILVINQDIKLCKEQTQRSKLQIWQRKNQIMELEEELNQQIQIYNQLYNELGDEESQQEGERQNETQPSQEKSQYSSYEPQSNTESHQSQSYSKPSCSIKYFISNRTITTPNFSNKILSAREQQKIYIQNDSGQQYTQLFLKQQQNQKFQQNNQNELREYSTQQNMLSFKKTEQSIFEQP